jgi:hypothetical protein
MSETMLKRVGAAQDLVRRGKYREATDEFEWLWENMDRVEPGMYGARMSLLAKYIGRLVGKHPSARVTFTEIRDRAAILATADHPTARLCLDWIVLNEILGEQERTLAWFDSVKKDERYATLLDRVAHRLVPLLTSRDRFADIGRMYKDPVATFVNFHHTFQAPPHIDADPYHPDPQLSPNLQSVMRQGLRRILDRLPKHVIREATLLVKCLLAAGRTADADAVEREARRLDRSAAMRAALEKVRGN